MIQDVASALMTIYNSTSAAALRALNTGGMYFEQAHKAAVEPFIVFSWDGSETEDEAGGRNDVIETAAVSFDVFSGEPDGGRECFKIADAFMDLFDWKTVPYAVSKGYDHLAMRRTSTGPMEWIDEIWNISINYEVMFHH